MKTATLVSVYSNEFQQINYYKLSSPFDDISYVAVCKVFLHKKMAIVDQIAKVTPQLLALIPECEIMMFQADEKTDEIVSFTELAGFKKDIEFKEFLLMIGYIEMNTDFKVKAILENS